MNSSLTEPQPHASATSYCIWRYWAYMLISKVRLVSGSVTSMRSTAESPCFGSAGARVASWMAERAKNMLRKPDAATVMAVAAAGMAFSRPGAARVIVPPFETSPSPLDTTY